MLRTHCQTSGVSLTEQDPYNNIVRTTIEALAAVLGGTQSLHTNSFDEAIALPDASSRPRIARNTQLILAEETGITHVVDPLGGSYYVEALTAQPRRRGVEAHRGGRGARRHDQGGRVRACRSSASRSRPPARQARVDRGEEVIVGVNKYRLADEARRSTSARSTTPRCASSRSPGSRSCGPTRDDAALPGRARRAHARAPRGDGNLLELSHRGDARPRHGRRDLRRPGGGVRAPPGRRSVASRACTARPTRATRATHGSAPRSRSSPPPRAAGRASSSSSSARTATTAAPR